MLAEASSGSSARSLGARAPRSPCSSRFARVRVVVDRDDGSHARPGMALGRMAARRAGANQVRALDVASEHLLQGDGPNGEEPLANRAFVPGPERRARPRPLRGPLLRRLASPRQRRACLLRLSGRRTRAIFSPLGPRQSSQPFARTRGLSAIFRTLSSRCASCWSARVLVRWLPRCPCCLRDFESAARQPTRRSQ